MNTQEEMFDKNYPEVFDALEKFIRAVLSGVDTTEAKQRVINSLIDTYSYAFYSEVSYLLDTLGVDVDSTEINNIQNGIDTTAFMRGNYSRIMTILNNNEEKIRKSSIDGLTDEEVKNAHLSDLVRIALSETHMCVEQASVNSSKLTQDVLDIKLTKTWNCVGDGRSCEICMAMNGTTVPVDESFAKYAPTGIASELGYTGGDTTYAHPRCRCWLTYSKA